MLEGFFFVFELAIAVAAWIFCWRVFCHRSVDASSNVLDVVLFIVAVFSPVFNRC